MPAGGQARDVKYGCTQLSIGFGIGIGLDYWEQRIRQPRHKAGTAGQQV